MADTMRATAFNEAVRDSNIHIEIRWNSYEYIVADTATAAADFQSMLSVDIGSESQFIIGDHVIFFNHGAFDDMNMVYHNVPGNFSNWRLENAIITDMDPSGEFRFQGHGCFSPKRRSALVEAMVGKMDELVDAGQSAIASGDTQDLGFASGSAGRFEFVRSSGAGWAIHYHEGMGRSASLPVRTMPLRHVSAADCPHPFVQPGQSQIRVHRPIESRRESRGGGASPAATTQQAGASPQQDETPPQPSPQTDESRATPRPFVWTGPRLLGACTPYNGRDDEFKYCDFPSLSTCELIRVAPFPLMSDGMLEFGMNNLLGLLAGTEVPLRVRRQHGTQGNHRRHAGP